MNDVNEPARHHGRRTDSRVDPGRRVAYNVLHEVGAEGAYANLALRTQLDTAQLTPSQAAWVTDAVNQTLRFRRPVDAIIDSVHTGRGGELQWQVRDILRLGTVQLLLMSTPTHSAVDESVKLTRSVVGDRPTGLVNALLRAVSRHSWSEWLDLIGARIDDDLLRLGLITSHPDWMVTALADVLRSSGSEEELPALLHANNAPPPVTLVLRPGLDTPSPTGDNSPTGEWAAGKYSPYARRAPAGSLATLSGLKSGVIGVQDEGSQLVTLALAEATVTCSDTEWLDMCAGPGGKFALLAAIARERTLAGGQAPAVVGIEVHEHRAHLARTAVRAVKTVPGGRGVDVRVEVADARERDSASRGASRILVDAPCTGVGVVRRRADVRWRRSLSDLATLTGLQSDLLRAAVHHVQPGGVIAYVTCSPLLAETVGIVESVRRAHPELQPVTSDRLEAIPGSRDGDYYRLWPHRHDTDGMFLALLHRTG